MSIKTKIISILKEIEYSLKTNFFIRSLARKTIYRYPHIIHWKKHNLKINIKHNNNSSKKKILIAPIVNADQTLICLHSLLGVSLSLKDCEVNYLICDAVLPACTNAINFVINEDEFIEHGPKKVCNSCYDCNHTLFNQIDKNYLKLSNFLTKEDFKNAEELSLSMSKEEIINYTQDNINIGEHCLAGTLRFYGIGDINIKKNSTKVLRKYFTSALLVKKSFEKILDKNQYDAVVVDHGLYIPQGIITEVSNNRKIPTKVIWQGYKENSLLISDTITYHKSLINEKKENWINYDFNSEKKIKIMNYLKERNTGMTDWFSFNKNPDMNWEKFKKDNNIEKKLIITLMTNVIWDAQLKFDQNIFKDQMEWINTTINFFKEKKNIYLIIRIHPAEIRGDVPSDQRIEDEIKKTFLTIPENIKLIKPENKFSSYKLGIESNAILVYATKLSFELPCYGKNVVVCGEAFGKNKGFTHDPKSKEEYIKILNNLPFKDDLEDNKIELAQRYAYHFFFRRSMFLNSLKKIENQYPPFKLRDDFIDHFKNKKDPSLEIACNSIINNKPAILDV